MTATEEPTAIDFYWRPGCGFCMMLDRKLSSSNVPMTKHNIWDDEDASAFVRSVANGNETVPTVVVGDMFMVNPSAKEVLAAMAAKTPHLVPDNSEADRGGVSGLIDRIRGS